MPKRKRKLPRIGTTEVTKSPVDGKLRRWRFVPLREAGGTEETGAWHKPQWIITDAFWPRRKRRKR